MSALTLILLGAFVATLPTKNIRSESDIAYSKLPQGSKFIGGYSIEKKHVPGMVHTPLSPEREMWENDLQFFLFYPKKIYPKGESLTLYYSDGYQWNWEKDKSGEIYFIFSKIQ
jgi:hypothetical protein